MDTSFCIGALDDALVRATPEILNTDQGSQFTSEAFADRVLGAGVAFSMDGRAASSTTSSSSGVAVAEVRGRVPPRTPRRAGRRTHHRVVDRLLQRGAPAFVPGRAHPGRRLPQRHGGTVNAATSHVPGRALRESGGPRSNAGSAHPGRLAPPAARPRSPVGFPSRRAGFILEPVLPLPGRIAGWSIHPKQTQSESYRGLSQPLGIHLNYALDCPTK